MVGVWFFGGVFCEGTGVQVMAGNLFGRLTIIITILRDNSHK